MEIGMINSESDSALVVQNIELFIKFDCFERQKDKGRVRGNLVATGVYGGLNSDAVILISRHCTLVIDN